MSELDLHNKQYTHSVRGRIARGWDRFLQMVRYLVAGIPPHLISSVFYMFAGGALMYIELTQPADVVFGLRVLPWLPWWVFVFLFFACGWVLAQKRVVEVYLVAHIPAFVYGVILLYGIINGDVGVLASLAAIYLLFGVAAMARSAAEAESKRVLVRLQEEAKRRAETAMEANARTAVVLEQRESRLNAAYDKLIEAGETEWVARERAA